MFENNNCVFPQQPYIGLTEARFERSAYVGALKELNTRTIGELPIAPLIVTKKTFDELLHAGKTIFDLCFRAVQNLGTDTNQRLGAIGIDRRRVPMITDDDDYEFYASNLICRSDVILTADGLRFVEINVGGAVGGMPETDALWRLWRHKYNAGPNTIDILCERIRHYLKKYELETIVMVGSIDEMKDRTDRPYTVFIDRLNDNGINAVFVDRADVVRSNYYGKRVAIWQNFTTYEWEKLGFSYDAIVTWVENGGILFPSRTSFMIGDKRIFAILSEGQPWLTTTEREVIEKYIPWTRILSDNVNSFQGMEGRITDICSEYKDIIVIKDSEAMRSDNVFFGINYSNSEWKSLLTSLLSEKRYIVQEFHKPSEVSLNVVDDEGRLKQQTSTPILSPFVIGGREGGIYCRVGEKDRGLAICARAGAFENIVAYLD